MEYGKIAEIRGISKDQNLEPEMEEVVEEKIKDFPDKEKYYKKVSDMKLLTHIYKKHKNNEELTKEELRFLYEVDGKIIGFGYKEDPRIEEIINARDNIKQDLSFVLDCREDQIALNKNELTKDNVYYKGDLDLFSLTSAEGLVLPQIIVGNLILSGLKSTKGLVLPKILGGILDLSGLTSAEGLVLPKNIEGSLNLSGLMRAENLVLPEYIGGTLYLNRVISAKGLVFPKNIEGSLDLIGLKRAENLVLPKNIGGNLYLTSLTSAEGLVLPEHIGGALELYSLTSAEGLIIPDPLTYKIYMAGFIITPQNVDQYRNIKKMS